MNYYKHNIINKKIINIIELLSKIKLNKTKANALNLKNYMKLACDFASPF